MSTEASRARGAVAALFLVNGAMTGNLVPRFPDLKAELGLSNTAFGSAVGAYGLGALALGLLGGLLVRRFGSRRVAWVSSVGDRRQPHADRPRAVVARAGRRAGGGGRPGLLRRHRRRAHGLRVERLYGRSILNSLHGVWSIGAVVGGVMGSAAAGLDIAVDVHLTAAACLFAAVALAASRSCCPGPTTRRSRRARPPEARPRHRRARPDRRDGADDGVHDGGVGGVYLREELGAAAAISGLGFIALQSTQTGRPLLGDRVVTRYGDRTVARAGAALAGVAMAAALALPSIAITIVALALSARASARSIPGAMRAADRLLPNGMGLMLVGTVLRIALLVVPPLIGVLADASSLRAALLVMPAGRPARRAAGPALRRKPA